MSDSSRLPARPSLEYLRKLAKERVKAMRAVHPDATLAAAQLAVARDYGFDSWPKLAHHVEDTQITARLEPHRRLAEDVFAGVRGDDAAVARSIAHFGVSYDIAQWRLRLRQRLDDIRGATDGEPSRDDARQLIAREAGFTGWDALYESMARHVAGEGASSPSEAPFYRLADDGRTIEPRGPLSERDWDALFAVMRERRLTAFRAATITDEAMAKLAGLDFVTAIDVGGAQLLTDDGLLHLAKMPQLESLSLGGWHTTHGDRGLAALAHLPRLRYLAMPWARHVTDAGMAHVAACDQIEEVHLMGTATGDGAIAALRGKERLRHLETGRLVTDAAASLLHDLPFFRRPPVGEITLDLMSFSPKSGALMLDGPITDRGLAALAGLDGLVSLSLFWHSTAFTGAGLASLAALPHLQVLGVNGDACDDAAMAGLAALPRLRKLGAQGAVASDDGFAALSRSASIEYFWGRDCPNFTGRGLTAMARMPALRGLGVSCKGVDDASLAALPAFPALEQLMPMDVSDAGFAHVGRCRKLTHLWCMYCRDTGDEATRHVADLALRTYYAGRTLITDASLDILGRMSSLEQIELWQTAGISDVGVAALIGLPNLTSITIDGAPRVSREQMRKFRSGIKVTHDL